MKAKTVKISELTPDDINANKGTPRGSAMLEKSLREYGAGRSVLVDKAGRIIAGNKTIEAAGSIGLEDAVMVETDGSRVVIVKRTDLDLDSPQGRGLAIADNRVAEVGLEWDMEALEKIGEELDLGEFWFDDELPEIDFGSIDGDEDDEPTGDADAVPEVEDVPTSNRGDLWTLGEHRVLCGDSTNAEDVARLMNGEKADLVFTDPPYDLAGKSRRFGISELRGESYGKLYAADWDRGFDIEEIERSLDFVAGDNSSIYVCTSHFYLGELINIFDRLFKYSNVCVWSKSNPMPSLAKRHWTWSHEFVMYGTRGSHVFNFPIEGNAPSVWNLSKNPKNDLHPTQKPIHVPAHAISHSSKPGQTVADLFLGSGSTLIAAEETGRRCYGMELSPQYVDVIVKRWQDYTGKEATHEDGRTFAQVAEERASNEAQETEE